MNAAKALWKYTEDTLNSLGESTMQTIAWQMSERGVEMAPDNFDINRFFTYHEKKVKKIWQEENR